MNDNDMNLRDMGIPGVIVLKMVAPDTDQNCRIHAAFKELAKVECKDDYTLALGKLLEYYQADAKTQMLWFAIEAMSKRLDELEMKAQEPTEEGLF